MVTFTTRPKAEAVAVSVASPSARLLPDPPDNTYTNILALERVLGGLMLPGAVLSCNFPMFRCSYARANSTAIVRGAKLVGNVADTGPVVLVVLSSNLRTYQVVDAVLKAPV